MLLDQLRVEAARAAIGARRLSACCRPLHQLAAAAPPETRAVAADAVPLMLGDHLLDRPAGRGLHDDEVDAP